MVKNGLITENTMMGSSAYNAGLENGDKIIKVGDVLISNSNNFNKVLSTFKPTDEVKIVFERLGITKETTVILQSSQAYNLSLFETNAMKLSKDQKESRAAWLKQY